MEVSYVTEPKMSPTFSSEGNFGAGWWNGREKCGHHATESPNHLHENCVGALALFAAKSLLLTMSGCKLAGEAEKWWSLALKVTSPLVSGIRAEVHFAPQWRTDDEANKALQPSRHPVLPLAQSFILTVDSFWHLTNKKILHN